MITEELIKTIKEKSIRNNYLFQRRRIDKENSNKKTLGWIMTPDNSEKSYENVDINKLKNIQAKLENNA